MNMSTSQKASYEAGKVQEKANNVKDKTALAAHSAKDSVQHAGGHMQAKAGGAVESVKDTVHIHK